MRVSKRCYTYEGVAGGLERGCRLCCTCFKNLRGEGVANGTH